MGVYFRKSVNLGGGFKLNFSKRGVGISGGVKGARISTGPSGTYMNLSIPGTGIYYRKRLSGSNSSYRTSTTPSDRYPYQRTIVNEYTGERRTVRATSQWELDEQVRNEELRMHNNELRARRNAQITSQKEKAEEMTRQVRDIQNSFRRIIADTIKINDRLDWDKQYNRELYPDFSFSEDPPIKKNISFWDKLSGKTDDYEEKIKDYEERKTRALQEYFALKQEFEAEQREHNADVDFLKESFEACEESAIEKYASVILANSKYPPELDMDYDVDYISKSNMMIVSFLLPHINDFPLIDRYSYNESTGEIRGVSMSKENGIKFYERTLLAVGIRTIHELFEAIYNGSVETIVFKGYLLTNEATEDIIEFNDNVRQIFEISANKAQFEKIQISDDNINETLQHLEFTCTNDFVNTIKRL